MPPVTEETAVAKLQREFSEYKKSNEERMAADRRELERLKQKDSIDLVIKKPPVPRNKVNAWIAKNPEFGRVYSQNKVKHTDREVILISQKRIDLGNGISRDCRPLVLKFKEMPEGVLNDLPYSIKVASIWDLDDMSYTKEELEACKTDQTKGMRPKPSGDYPLPEVLAAFREAFVFHLSRLYRDPLDPWPEFMDGEGMRAFATAKIKSIWDDEDNKRAEVDARKKGDIYAIKSGNISTPISEIQFAGV